MCAWDDESNESDVAPKAASLLSRGAAADCSPGALAQLEFQMVCEGTGWGHPMPPHTIWGSICRRSAALIGCALRNSSKIWFDVPSTSNRFGALVRIAGCVRLSAGLENRHERGCHGHSRGDGSATGSLE